jgi:hypothetical protein
LLCSLLIKSFQFPALRFFYRHWKLHNNMAGRGHDFKVSTLHGTPLNFQVQFTDNQTTAINTSQGDLASQMCNPPWAGTTAPWRVDKNVALRIEDSSMPSQVGKGLFCDGEVRKGGLVFAIDQPPLAIVGISHLITNGGKKASEESANPLH